MGPSRRGFVAGAGLAALGKLLPSRLDAASSGKDAPAGTGTFPFRLAVINDEITQDFERCCHVVANDFGLRWIELRAMWDKNVTALTQKEVAEARKILAEHQLRVTDLASPLFKTDWPGAPLSNKSEKRDQFHSDYDAKAQDRLLEQCIELAHAFDTDRIRCFDYWRLEDQKPYRSAINATLRNAAVRCSKDKLILLLENEMSCNTATGEESAAVLRDVPNPNFMLNWDPGNAAALGSKPYPDGYALLPKDRIGHCHCKDVVYNSQHKYEWAPVGGGVVDWVGQLRALNKDSFHYGLSLETHWRGAGTPEASTRVSMRGLTEALIKAGIPTRETKEEGA